MEYLAAAALGGLLVLIAAGWGWTAAETQQAPRRGVPGPMRLVVDRPAAPPPTAAQEALRRLEAVVAAHRAGVVGPTAQGAIRSPRQS